MIPHPVAPYLRYDGSPKKSRIVCVGRWDDHVQKNPALAVSAIIYVLSRRPECDAVFIGSGRACIESLAGEAGLPADRILILDKLRHPELVGYFQSAQVSLCSSYYESGHIVSEEALCCGCSVVAPDLPALPSLKYYVSRQSGRLGGSTADTLGAALLEEIDCWASGGRDAAAISRQWCYELHADRIAENTVRALGL
jgi:hypothetical protein